ncbi:DUF4331 family protein [Methylocystis sp. IM2]|uniref:DUF4331 family protein n=1 Tax=Methylocystis sp. IM2 TaxID=3136563 RepID=UPI0030F7762B
MSNHFTGLSLGPPLDDQRLDLCDLYVFQSPADSTKTVFILNANPAADGFHPDAIYRLNIDTDGDCVTDVAISYIFSPVIDGRQNASVFIAKGNDARSPEAVGEKIICGAEVSFKTSPNVVSAGPYRFFAGSRSDAFFFDLEESSSSTTRREDETSRRRKWAGKRLGRELTRICKRTYARRSSRFRRRRSIPSR